MSPNQLQLFSPHKTIRRTNYNFLPFKLDVQNMCFVDKYKYYGHFLSILEDNNADIMNQRCLLYTRTNLLTRKFAKCSTELKLCLLRTYCINFYGIFLWRRYNSTVLKKFEAAYKK